MRSNLVLPKMLPPFQKFLEYAQKHRLERCPDDASEWTSELWAEAQEDSSTEKRSNLDMTVPHETKDL
jgi:hypothetical protein